MSVKYIIGIDEVGRGPLAGRVFVGAVLLPKKFPKNFFKTAPAPLRDSKKLSHIQREKWLTWMKANDVIFTTSAASANTIDKRHIHRTIHFAATRVARRIFKKTQIDFKETHIITDGGIIIQEKSWQWQSLPKADENYPAVSLASIAAKVLRDREMDRLHKKYPRYGFNKHKGYGTAAHIKAIKKYGPSPIHRRSFIRGITSSKPKSNVSAQ